MIFYAKMEGRGCGGRHAMHRGGGRGFGHGFGHGFGGGRRGGGGRGERGERRRMFDGGELRLVLLKLIADEPRHGYDLIRHIEELTGGSYAPSPGVIYPTLTMLDDMGLIEAQQSDGAKKLFAITDTGRAELETNSEIVEVAIARLSAVGEETQRTDSASVRRAMGNLRQVLMNRLGDRDLGADKLHDIVALIDEAAQKIERL
ncbi:transcriptional regulator, PadR family [Sphingopyxis sp. YR583]|jgi:DNA-binding PadR family transcriptional regulator|uniref:PadR family transcriptional regulator n=1 Tax=Sphingopyxis sp. YR583 TaxID=1881047 RepID=UPI0008A78C57|nr:PadR family transcriptional regulator [Sphingopyxis sp. YR583]SEH20286.1 transcriptional regulator, PadR family [Sphingopyxis sp. YR583]